MGAACVFLLLRERIILSREILQQTFINSATLNTEQLARGLYLFEVRDKNGLCKKGKLVKD